MQMNESVLRQEPDGIHNEKSLTVIDANAKSTMTELRTAASELSAATEQLLELMGQPGLVLEEILEQSNELLSVYDEYLDVLEIEIDSRSNSRMSTELDQSSQLAQEDLIGLYLIFDYDREVLRTAFGLIQAEVIGTTPNKGLISNKELTEDRM